VAAVLFAIGSLVLVPLMLSCVGLDTSGAMPARQRANIGVALKVLLVLCPTVQIIAALLLHGSKGQKPIGRWLLKLLLLIIASVAGSFAIGVGIGEFFGSGGWDSMVWTLSR
jgi:hypothetical protein